MDISDLPQNTLILLRLSGYKLDLRSVTMKLSGQCSALRKKKLLM